MEPAARAIVRQPSQHALMARHMRGFGSLGSEHQPEPAHVGLFQIEKVEEEEEQLKREEEEAERQAAENERLRQEELRIEQEKKEARKQRKHERKERLKADGKFLTEKQRQDLAKSKLSLEVLRAQG